MAGGELGTPRAPADAGHAPVQIPGDEEAWSVSSSPGYSPSALGENLSVGNNLPRPRGPPKPLADVPRDDEAAVVPHGTANKRRRKVEEKKKKREAILDQAVTRGGTMSGLQRQLVLRAAENANQKARKKKEESKKEASKNPGQKLLKILTEAVRPKKDRKAEKRKKKKKEKKAKRRQLGVKPDPDGSSSDPSGNSPTPSSGDGSDKESTSTSSSEKKDKYEPPLKKRSKKHPGSVLKLLVEHARTQLDQTAKVSVDQGTLQDPTQGVRLASYFNIVVKPQIQGAQAANREMHFLSNGMDMLRAGQLDSLGDLMASRFIAVHQSTIDGGWHAARHLELLPYEEVSAAGTAVVLEARKHAQTTAKALNTDPSGWKGAYKGRGGRGKGGGQEDWQYEGKGKSRKGDKGKGKNKNWWQNNVNPEGEGKDAGKRKEKAGEK